MKIAYVSITDPRDVHAWSGTVHRMATALEAQGCELEYVGPLASNRTLESRASGFLHNRVLKQRYLADRDPVMMRDWAAQVERAVAGKSVDAVFSPSSMPLAYLETDMPKVFWTDATFAAMVEFNPSFSGLAECSVREGNAAEQAALDTCAAAIYASQWAAESAVKHYNANPAKVHVVPFGGNVTRVPTLGEMLQAVAMRPRDRCKLLFVGTDWDLKGGDMAVDLARELNDCGLKTELTVVGSRPANHAEYPAYVKFEGVLDKAEASQAEHLEELFADSHFLVMPSRAEAYGIVFAEAAANGVLSLATEGGGIASAVKDGESGRLFPREQFVNGAAREVLRFFNDMGWYGAKAMAARRHYDETVNWDVAGKRVVEILERIRRR